MLNDLKRNKYIYMLLLVMSFAFVFFNTAMSPLYNEAYITHDASVFYLIGRSMKVGKIPYKDLFDHKGIYLYFIYYLASLITEYKMIGLFLIFSIFSFVFSVFTYKIVNIYKNKYVSVFTAIILNMFSTCVCFSHDSLLCEYIALVFIMISAYFMCKHIKEKDIFYPKYMLINGILCGINLFNKPNYCFYFLVVAIYAFIELAIIKKDYKLLFKNVIYGLIGVIIALLPGIIYCIVNDCLNDMFFATFIFNARYVVNNTMPKTILYTLKEYMHTYIICIISFIILIYKKVNKNVILFFVGSFILLAVATFIPLRAYHHYMTLLIPFFIPVCIVFLEGIENIFVGVKKRKGFEIITKIIVFIIIFCFSLIIGRENLIINYYTTSKKAERTKKELSRYIKLDKNAKVLCYGYGTYNYNYMGLIPNEKYFYVPGIDDSEFTEPYDSLWDDITDFKNDVVLYCTEDTLNEMFGDDILMFLEDNYVKVKDEGDYSKIFITEEVYSEYMDKYGDSNDEND